MKAISFAFLGVLALALSSCGSGNTLPHISIQPSKPAQGARVIGTLQLGENGSSISAQGSVIDEKNGAVGVQYVGKTVNDNLTTGTRYIDYSYRIQNNTNQAWTNTTCVGHYANGSSLANTWYRNVKNAARELITDPTIIRSISESRPTFNNGSNIVFLDAESGYQIVTPTESSQVQQDALAVGMIQSQDIVLSMGYRLIGENQPWVIQPGEWGKLSFASQTPIRDAATTPLIFGNRCVLFQQATTRVTRAPSETTASAVARANAVGATELMLTGTDTDMAPTPLKTLRNFHPAQWMLQAEDLTEELKTQGKQEMQKWFNQDDSKVVGYTYAQSTFDQNVSFEGFERNYFKVKGFVERIKSNEDPNYIIREYLDKNKMQLYDKEYDMESGEKYANVYKDSSSVAIKDMYEQMCGDPSTDDKYKCRYQLWGIEGSGNNLSISSLKPTVQPPLEGSFRQKRSGWIGVKAAEYAKQWGRRFNPQFDHAADDCTNFISQALLAGGWIQQSGIFLDPDLST